jgi:putative ATP-dependent endonuclease of OLD family
VEGETEFWLLPELARLCGHDFTIEGVVCVEFAQSGLTALLKVAEHLGIEWHLLADGDRAGQSYASSAHKFVAAGNWQRRVTLLQEKDVEHCFRRHGFADVFRKAAFPAGGRPEKMPAKAVIGRAIEKRSKPFLAVQLLEAVAERGPDAVPPPLRRAIETCVDLARRCLATPASATGVSN